MRVIGPVEAVGRAGRAGQRRRRRGHDDVDLFPLGGDSLHRKRNRGQGEVADHVDAFDVIPAARDGRSEIHLVLVVGVDPLDLPAEHAAAEVLDRYFRGFDRPLAVKVGVGSGLVGKNADLDALRRSRRARKHTAGGDCGGRQLDYPHIANHIPLPVCRLAAPVGCCAEFGKNRPQ
jgi:hypothetical protein